MVVILGREALKYLERLSKPDIKRIALALRKLSQEPPEGDVSKMQGRHNEYRLRVGEWRILFKIEVHISDNNTRQKSIVVYKIASRGQAYKE